MTSKAGKAAKLAADRPRWRKAAATRARIIETAAEVFAREGYKAATLRDIGARARVDHAMTVRYAGSKAGLFTAALSKEVTRWPGCDASAGGVVLAARLFAGKDDRLWRLVLIGEVTPVPAEALRFDLLAKMGLTPALPSNEEAVFAQNMLFVTCLGAAAMARSRVAAATAGIETAEARLGNWLQWLLDMARTEPAAGALVEQPLRGELAWRGKGGFLAVGGATGLPSSRPAAGLGEPD